MQPFVVASEADARGLLNELIVQSVFERAVIGLDFETTGCNPQVETPVGKARVWCMTVAWGEPAEQTPSPFKTAFVPRDYLEHFRLWLECPAYEKVGTNLFGFDRHACKNEGIELRGVHACTTAMSRLLNPSKSWGHGLDDLGQEMGYPVKQGKYKLLTTVASPGPEHRKREWACPCCVIAYLRQRKLCKLCKLPVVEITTATWTDVVWEQKELTELWERYPEKRAEIVAYATQDPAMSLDAFHLLKRKLADVKW